MDTNSNKAMDSSSNEAMEANIEDAMGTSSIEAMEASIEDAMGTSSNEEPDVSTVEKLHHAIESAKRMREQADEQRHQPEEKRLKLHEEDEEDESGGLQPGEDYSDVIAFMEDPPHVKEDLWDLAKDIPELGPLHTEEGFRRVWANVATEGVDFAAFDAVDPHLTAEQRKGFVGLRTYMGDVPAEALLAKARKSAVAHAKFAHTANGEPLLASHVAHFLAQYYAPAKPSAPPVPPVPAAPAVVHDLT